MLQSIEQPPSHVVPEVDAVTERSAETGGRKAKKKGHRMHWQKASEKASVANYSYST
jgi:hypothetical protein